MELKTLSRTRLVTTAQDQRELPTPCFRVSPVHEPLAGCSGPPGSSRLFTPLLLTPQGFVLCLDPLGFVAEGPA